MKKLNFRPLDVQELLRFKWPDILDNDVKVITDFFQTKYDEWWTKNNLDWVAHEIENYDQLPKERAE